MTAQHIQGPVLVYGYSPPTGTGTSGDYNPDAGPSCEYQGDTVFDPRYPYSGGGNALGGLVTATGIQWASFFNSPFIQIVDAVPAVLSNVNIAAAQAPTISTALTLVAATGAGVTVSTAAAVSAGYLMQGSAPDVKALAGSTKLLALDGLYGPLGVGPQAIHDPTKALCRAVSLTSTGGIDFSAITFTIRGHDLFGYKMIETMVGPTGNTTRNGKKAFKYIQSITPSATNASANLSAGTTDIYGFNLRSVKWEYANVFWNGAFVTVSTGWVTADTTSPATATTGDVRGTYALQSAADTVKRLAIFLSVPLADAVNSTPTNFATLFGVNQFSTGF